MMLDKLRFLLLAHVIISFGRWWARLTLFKAQRNLNSFTVVLEQYCCSW
jgi:hypothetical protein